MNEFNIKIGGVDYTAYFIYPLNFQFVLDTALDQGFIEARNMTVTEAFKPFTPVEITINNYFQPTLFYVGVDNVVVNQKTGRATHRILLTEETKILERVICRAKTFVKPLYNDYLSNPVETSPLKFNTVQQFESDTSFYSGKIYPELGTATNPTYRFYTNPTSPIYAKGVVSPLAVGTGFTISDVIGFNITEQVTSYQWMIEIFENSDRKGYVFSDEINNTKLIFDTPGAYTMNVWMWVVTATTTHTCAAQYFVASANPATAPSDLYITDTVNKLLEIAEPIRDGETPRFSLSNKDASRFRRTQCAEFNFANGATLWENLLEIARTVHCIPRLKNNVVYFDDLGSGIKLQSSALGTPVSYTADATSEKFASHIDSVVNGLMNLDDEDQGAISDPFKNGFRTLRSETSFTDVRTTVDTALVRTVKPIEKATKVSVWYNGAEWDITPYIYEKKEYDLLYSNQGSYPYAKAYALYYVQGQPNIYGITYKEANPISPIFENWAIENILSIVTGTKVDLDSRNDTAGYLLNLSFNVTYISTVNGRVKQSKRNVEDLKINSVMAFNQSANRLSSINFGKRLKGEIAMLGSAEKKLVFKTRNWNAVKNAVGKIYGDENYGKNMYISTVTAKIWRDYILVELGLTKNFNQLGKYVGINSAVRQFEFDTNVSETYLLYEDYVCIDTVGNTPTDASGTTISNGGMIVDSVAQTLRPTDNVGKATLAVVTTYGYDKTEIGKFVLPVQSMALGNSLLFNFRFEDNYSAGEYLQSFANTPYKLTRLARYGDALYGEAWGMRVQIYCDVGYNTGTKSSVGDGLPLFDRATISVWGSGENTALYGALVVDSGENPIIIHKSSRDAINFTYQVHLITNSGFILGDALTQTNFLVGGDTNSSGNNENEVYFLEDSINEMTGDMTSGIVNDTRELNKNGLEITLDRPISESYSAWAIYNKKGQFVMGKNGQFEPITLTQFHKIGG
jgi:hypothetical protein